MNNGSLGSIGKYAYASMPLSGCVCVWETVAEPGCDQTQPNYSTKYFDSLEAIKITQNTRKQTNNSKLECVFFTLDDRMCTCVCAPKQMNIINKCGQTYQMSENIIWWNFYSAPRGNANRYELIILKAVHIHEEEKTGDNNITDMDILVATLFVPFLRLKFKQPIKIPSWLIENNVDIFCSVFFFKISNFFVLFPL